MIMAFRPRLAYSIRDRRMLRRTARSPGTAALPPIRTIGIAFVFRTDIVCTRRDGARDDADRRGAANRCNHRAATRAGRKGPGAARLRLRLRRSLAPHRPRTPTAMSAGGRSQPREWVRRCPGAGSRAGSRNERPIRIRLVPRHAYGARRAVDGAAVDEAGVTSRRLWLRGGEHAFFGLGQSPLQ
jgi:hypothetical protein